MNETTGGGKVLLMFLLGTAAGAVAGLLLAPRSGRETRRRLRNALQEIQHRAADLSGEDSLRGGVMKSYDEEHLRTGSGSSSDSTPYSAPSSAARSYMTTITPK